MIGARTLSLAQHMRLIFRQERARARAVTGKDAEIRENFIAFRRWRRKFPGKPAVTAQAVTTKESEVRANFIAFKRRREFLDKLKDAPPPQTDP